jgi:hypothetical protein
VDSRRSGGEGLQQAAELFMMVMKVSTNPMEEFA